MRTWEMQQRLEDPRNVARCYLDSMVEGEFAYNMKMISMAKAELGRKEQGVVTDKQRDDFLCK